MAGLPDRPAGTEPAGPLHRTLLRQLRRLHLSPSEPPTPEAWREFVERVSATYAQADDDRYTLERAIDISSDEMQQLHAMLARRARTDDLTGLANRAALVDDLSAALAYAPGAPEVIVLFIDLDHFKAVNDRYGHSVGDELLVQVASRLRSSVRHGDLVARYGGDEFVAVLGGQTSHDTAVTIGQRIVELVGEPFHLGVDQPVRIGASVGVARALSGIEVSQLLHEADSAMYDAKLQGRGRLATFRGPRPLGRDHLRSTG